MTDKPDGPRGVTEEMSFLAKGVSISFLGTFFGMDKRHVAVKLAGVRVVGKGPNNHPLYDFKESILKLARPGADQLAEYVKTMRPNDLPPLMQSEFWQGQLRRQKFMLEAGDLWKTIDVLDMLADVFKTVRITTMLFADSVARETDLTPRQRTIISELSDAMLDELREKLTDNKNFVNYRNQRAEALEMFGEEAAIDFSPESATEVRESGESTDDSDGWSEAARAAFG